MKIPLAVGFNQPDTYNITYIPFLSVNHVPKVKNHPGTPNINIFPKLNGFFCQVLEEPGQPVSGLI